MRNLFCKLILYSRGISTLETMSEADIARIRPSVEKTHKHVEECQPCQRGNPESDQIFPLQETSSLLVENRKFPSFLLVTTSMIHEHARLTMLG